jgi:hypothetical protein
MTGGVIKDSVSTMGGAIATHNWGMGKITHNLVNLSGGEITGWSTDKLVGLTKRGAAMYIIDGKVTISGAVNIHDNGTDGKTEEGGAIYLSTATNPTEMTRSGGTIQGNAADNGAGVYVSLGCTFTISNGTITGNKAKYQGGGVYAYKSPYALAGATIVFNQNGGTITGNTPNDVYR